MSGTMQEFRSVLSNALGRREAVGLLMVALWLVTAPCALAEGGVSFTDVAAGGGAGLVYERTPSDSISVFNFFASLPIMTIADWPLTPLKVFGAPGVALLDYDGDGDLDIYVTNGPGTPNSLFQNQHAQTGQATFVDVAASAGVEATAQDSTGTCFGDVDNDGDPDLLVVSNFSPSRLFENNGDGTFDDISAASGIDGSGMSSVACSFGDVDNDGLLDVVVANNEVDMSNSLGIVIPFDFNQHNQLFRNLGGNQFADVSVAAGLHDTAGFGVPGTDGEPTLTWAIALVDLDQDGDADLLYADDQGGVPFLRDGGVDSGILQYFENDGTGQFTNRTVAAGLNRPGQWMGLSFGDFNADGHLDFFGTNAGDYNATTLTPLDPVYADFGTYILGDQASRWYLGSAGGAFADPGVGPLVATPFGWGTTATDYDNDGDTDILFHGGLYFGPIGQGCSSALLKNDGTATFGRDVTALAASTDHDTRTVQGVASGDLDGNGFADFVTVSNWDVSASDQVTYNHNWGGPFDGGRYTQIFTPTGDFSGDSFFSGIPILRGTLSVELNDGANGNNWVKVRTLGTTGITTGGSVNRDGIGAVVKVVTASGEEVLRPVVGGASYASQDSLEGVFGLDDDRKARVEILWPGGVRNRLDVRAGETILFPEIPCSLDGNFVNAGQYVKCVQRALNQLKRAGVISARMKHRFLAAFRDR